MRILLPLVVCACGSVAGSHHDAGIDTKTVDAAHDSSIDGPVLPVSCAAIKTAMPSAATGTYTIDPDGAGGDAALSVTCDMDTDGGGWTIVFFPATPAEGGLPIAYTSSTPRLLADAQRALIGYRAASLTMYTNYASFDLPTEWRTDTPFNAPGTDVSTGVSINGGTLATQTLRFGHANFSALCSDAWNATSDYGRICIPGTVAPYYSGFAIAGTDECSDSSQNYNVTACTNDLRFSIAVK